MHQERHEHFLSSQEALDEIALTTLCDQQGLSHNPDSRAENIALQALLQESPWATWSQKMGVRGILVTDPETEITYEARIDEVEPYLDDFRMRVVVNLHAVSMDRHVSSPEIDTDCIVVAPFSPNVISAMRHIAQKAKDLIRQEQETKDRAKKIRKDIIAQNWETFLAFAAAHPKSVLVRNCEPVKDFLEAVFQKPLPHDGRLRCRKREEEHSWELSIDIPYDVAEDIWQAWDIVVVNG